MQGVSVNCVVDIGYFGNTPETTVNKVAIGRGAVMFFVLSIRSGVDAERKISRMT
jgi:hypothetical protein